MFLAKLFKMFVPRKIEIHPWDERPEEIFLKDQKIADKWLRTFPEPPSLSGKKVIEIGCGVGALCVEAARDAEYVLGVEINKAMTDVCRDVVGRTHSELVSRIDFTEYEAVESGQYKGEFDVVLSQNAFEHYEDPSRVLDEMMSLLRPGGYIYAGFGPLWNSPYGSHLGSICKLPWMHLWNGEWLLNEHNRLRPNDIKASFRDLFLNQTTLADFENIFQESEDYKIVHFCYNLTIKQRAPALFSIIEIFRSLPLLREYLTASLFVVIKKGNL